MVEKLAGLWETKRWLFWLLLPLILGAVIIKYYLDYLEMKSERDMKETIEESGKLQAQQEMANKKAEEAKAEAEKIEERIEDRKEEDINIDWHLKD